MHKDLNRIRSDRMSRCSDVSNAIRQAVCGGQRVGKIAVCIVGNATAGIAVPGASADIAGGRNVNQLVVGGSVGIAVSGHVGRCARTCDRARCLNLLSLAVGQRYAGGLGLQNDGSYFSVLEAVGQSIAVVARWVARASRDRYPSRYGQA